MEANSNNLPLTNKAVIIKIWGDWISKIATEGIYKIKQIKQENNTCTVEFENDKKLSVYNCS